MYYNHSIHHMRLKQTFVSKDIKADSSNETQYRSPHRRCHARQSPLDRAQSNRTILSNDRSVLSAVKTNTQASFSLTNQPFRCCFRHVRKVIDMKLALFTETDSLVAKHIVPISTARSGDTNFIECALEWRHVFCTSCRTLTPENETTTCILHDDSPNSIETPAASQSLGSSELRKIGTRARRRARQRRRPKAQSKRVTASAPET